MMLSAPGLQPIGAIVERGIVERGIVERGIVERGIVGVAVNDAD